METLPGLDALLYGKQNHGVNATTFKLLPIGGRFSFPKTSTVYQKVNNLGWYSNGGARMRTGVNTVVMPVELNQ